MADSEKIAHTKKEVDKANPPQRLASLDQFRGYTVIGMLLVNYFGGFQACPQILKHTNDYCSYADTIMPHFLFAVGFSLRLTFRRRLSTQGGAAAYVRVAKRLLGLILVSLVVYSVSPRAANWQDLRELGFWGAIAEPLKRQWFQTLTHIAVTSLWLLPVIHARPSIRIAWIVGSGACHVILSYWFNFLWCNTAPNAIDGGPLGFLTWTIPAGLGSLACDWFVPRKRESTGNPISSVLVSDEQSTSSQISVETESSIGGVVNNRGDATSPVVLGLKWAAVLMLLGYLFSCGTRCYDVLETSFALPSNPKLAENPVVPSWYELTQKANSGGILSWFAEPPFIAPPSEKERLWNYWMMSQRAGTLSYLTFAAGFSLLVFVVFFVVCDIWQIQVGWFRTFGTNALLAYILHDLVSDAVNPFFPKDSPAWYAYTGLALFCVITWIFVRAVEKQGVYLRV
jgi:predicted acyltransferase